MVTQTTAPCTVGEILSEEFLKPNAIAPLQLAAALNTSLSSVTALLDGRRSLQSEEAHLLSQFFDTSPAFWLNLQSAHDRWEASLARSVSDMALCKREPKL